jgi:LacI family transcriptional regulator
VKSVNEKGSTTVGAGRKNVTMKDLALRAGVHHSSVSVVLNGSRSSAGVSAAARQRILDAAEEMGYRRNGSAHAIRTGLFGSLALLLSSQRGNSYLPPQLLSGLYDSLVQKDMTLMVCSLPDEELSDTGVLPKILRERMCDGMLIDYNKRIPESMVTTIERHQIPSIWINSKRDADCVYPDDFGAGMQATSTLLEMGHRRIAYVDMATPYPDDPQQHYSRRDRRSGYLAKMQEVGLEAQVWDANMSGADQVGFCKAKLTSEERPTAIVGYATWAMEAALHAAIGLGFKLPAELSLITFGPEQVDFMCQKMTMFLEPQYAVAEAATEMVLKKIAEPTKLLAPQSLQFIFEEGNSATPVA